MREFDLVCFDLGYRRLDGEFIHSAEYHKRVLFWRWGSREGGWFIFYRPGLLCPPHGAWEVQSVALEVLTCSASPPPFFYAAFLLVLNLLDKMYASLW